MPTQEQKKTGAMKKLELEIEAAETNLNRYQAALTNLQRFVGLNAMQKEDADHAAILAGKTLFGIWQIQAGMVALTKQLKELTPDLDETDNEDNSDNGDQD